MSQRYIQYIHRALSEALGHAVKKKLLTNNPIKDITNIPRVPKYRAQIYNKVEIIQLLNIIKGSDMECPIALAALCGLCRGEVLGLKWNDIDLNNSTLNISIQLIATDDGYEFDTPKSETSIRKISIPATVLSILEDQNL